MKTITDTIHLVTSLAEKFLDPEIDSSKQVHALTTNSMILIGIPVICVLAALDYSQGLVASGTGGVFLITILAISLRLNKKGENHIAAPVCAFSVMLISLVTLLLSGQSPGFQYLYIAYLGLPVLLFEPGQNFAKVSAILTALGCFFFIHFAPANYYFRTLEIQNQGVRELVYIIAGIVILMAQFVYWSLINEAAIKQTTDQRMKLTESNHLSSLGVMAAGIAHEINNPLMVIKGVSEILEQESDDFKISSGRIKKMITGQSDSVDRIISITSGLRTLARDGRKDPFEQVDLDDIIQKSVTLSKEKAFKEQVKLFYETDSNSSVVGREVQIGQVLLNLIGNAIDAIAGSKNPWIKIQIEESLETIQIKVIDSGLGIAPELFNQIMSPFFTTKEIGKGTGLGLSISASIIEAHGGTLEIDRDHKNTCFVMTFPNPKLKPQDFLNTEGSSFNTAS